MDNYAFNEYPKSYAYDVMEGENRNYTELEAIKYAALVDKQRALVMADDYSGVTFKNETRSAHDNLRNRRIYRILALLLIISAIFAIVVFIYGASIGKIVIWDESTRPPILYPVEYVIPRATSNGSPYRMTPVVRVMVSTSFVLLTEEGRKMPEADIDHFEHKMAFEEEECEFLKAIYKVKRDANCRVMFNKKMARVLVEIAMTTSVIMDDTDFNAHWESFNDTQHIIFAFFNLTVRPEFPLRTFYTKSAGLWKQDSMQNAMAYSLCMTSYFSEKKPYFPNPANCHWFIQCNFETYGEANFFAIHKCARGAIWDDEMERCGHADSANSDCQPSSS